MRLILDFDFFWSFIGLFLYLIFILACKLMKIRLKFNYLFMGLFFSYMITLFMACFCPIPIGKDSLEMFRFMYADTGGNYFSLIPFKELIVNLIEEFSLQGRVRWILREIIINCILFMPFGFLYNFTFNKQYTLKKILIRGFLLSLCIEIGQLCYSLWLGFPMRYFDVNDLIMNSLGTIIGYLCWKIITPFINKR